MTGAALTLDAVAVCDAVASTLLIVTGVVATATGVVAGLMLTAFPTTGTGAEAMVATGLT
jgi:hypothetical protein